MENLFNCDGRRFSAKIEGGYCEGVITIEDDIVYLCQNIADGGDCADKKGFKYSWFYEDSKGNIDNFVADLRLLEEEPQEGDWVYVSEEDPKCEDKKERIFLCKTPKGVNMCVTNESNGRYIRGEGFLAASWKYIKQIPKEVITEFTAEEALEIVAKQKVLR
jgi:hypothetical protein